MNLQDLGWNETLQKYFTKQTVDSKQFNGGTASKLAVGTKIYKLANHPGPVYLAVVDGETIPYLGLME